MSFFGRNEASTALAIALQGHAYNVVCNGVFWIGL
jgi:hypothetical protein